VINHQNNFATNLTSGVSATDTTSPLDSIPTIDAPFYLAFDATNINGNYEVVYVTSKTVTNVNHAALSYDHTIAEEVRMIVPAEEVDAISSGWVKVNETWAYASADDPTFVITIPTGGTARYSVGQKVKFTNNATTFYGIVTAVAATTLTVYGGTDYDVANSAITAIYVSREKAPMSFPLDPTKWTVSIISDTTSRSQACSADTWTNITSLSGSVPIGIWDINFHVDGFSNRTTEGTGDSCSFCLSTANNSASDEELIAMCGYYGSPVASSSDSIGGHASGRKILAIAAKTTYYLNGLLQNAGTVNTLPAASHGGTTRAFAICVYV
jgi:hypothetical protein